MRWLKASLALAVLATVCFSGAAQAARWRVGVFVGAPYYYPVVPGPYYYAPYPPPVVVEPEQRDVYVEQDQQGPPDAEQQPSQGTWFYCDASKSYYPYVKQCAGGWRQVPATPPAPGH